MVGDSKDYQSEHFKLLPHMAKASEGGLPRFQDLVCMWVLQGDEALLESTEKRRTIIKTLAREGRDRVACNYGKAVPDGFKAHSVATFEL